ncbi:target of Myb protein 1 [Actinidia rufa]|uniref:Target of Myb protein 1 n=1 Tax=Actinidia rufa TaxID=165716 RepID=A0A7J0E793_9ERIC|nr:target of Myb protein 1 [Actinidia rufa]
MSGSDVDNVENVVVPPPPPRPDFSLSLNTHPVPVSPVNCTITKPNATDPKFVQWEIDNCTILGWLFNSMEPGIYHVFMYHDMVPLLWSSLTKMYAHARNEARIFELYREIHQASQASLSLSVADYFAYLQSRWEELAQYEPLSEFTTEGGIAARRLDRQHTYQFLMGLKPEFETLRTQIVNTTPMPSIFEAFAMLDGDERRHRLLQLPHPPVTESTIPDQMAIAASGFVPMVAALLLHPELRETFKRNKEKSKASPRTAAISETSYGSPAAPTAPNLHQLQTQFQNQMEQLQLQFQTQLGTPHSLNPCQGEAPEDPSLFSRPVPLFESPQVASPTLPPVLTSDPRHMYSRRPPASDPLPQSSPESGNISPISSPVHRYPTRDRRPPDKLGFSNPNATKHSIAQYVSYQGLSDSYRTFIGHVSSTPIPRSVSEALRDPNWVTAMQDDLTATLIQQCHQSQFTVQRIIETAGDNEALLFEALNVNDEIQKVILKYEDLKKPLVVPQEPEPPMIPVAVEPDDSPRVGKEDALIRKPASSRAGAQVGNNDDMMDDLDEMIFGKKAADGGGGASEPRQDSQKQHPPKDDLISF